MRSSGPSALIQVSEHLTRIADAIQRAQDVAERGKLDAGDVAYLTANLDQAESAYEGARQALIEHVEDLRQRSQELTTAIKRPAAVAAGAPRASGDGQTQPGAGEPKAQPSAARKEGK